MAEPTRSGVPYAEGPVQWDPLMANQTTPRRSVGGGLGGTMSRRLIVIGILVVGLVVIGNAIRNDDSPSDSPVIDSAAGETIAAVREAETNAGVGGVQIEVNGDTLTLYGTVATTADLTVAEAVARSVVGPGIEIDNQLTAEDAIEGETVAPTQATTADLALQNRLSTLLAHNPIIFESASSEIAAESIPSLDLLATELTNIPNVSLLIAGHTDSDGEESANLVLSRDRADAVLAYLVGVGIEGSRLTAEGYGEAFPVADNVSQEGKALNRRIEILVQP